MFSQRLEAKLELRVDFRTLLSHIANLDQRIIYVALKQYVDVEKVKNLL